MIITSLHQIQKIIGNILLIMAGTSYLNKLFPTIANLLIKLDRNCLSVMFWSSCFKTTPSLYSLSISEKQLKEMSVLDNEAAIRGIRLCNVALNLPAEKVFCLISSKVSSRGTYTGWGFSILLSDSGSV